MNMPWLWRLASGCASSLLETSQAIVAQLLRQAKLTSNESENDNLAKELEQATDEQPIATAVPVLLSSANGAVQKLYQCFFQFGMHWRAIWCEDRSRPALEKSIRLLRTALSLCPSSASGRDELMFALANVLNERCQLRASYDDLQQCISLLREVLQLRPEGHPRRPASLTNLANAVGSRYALLGDVADLMEHVHLNQQALALRPEGHPDRSTSLNNLANALSDRYARFGDVADLEEHVHLNKQALALHPEGHPNRSTSLNNLANALSDRYAHFGDVADLEERIRLHQEALALHPEGHPNRSASLNNLANALSDRYARFGDVADLEENVRLSKQALALRPEGHPGRSSCLNNLATALSDRYARLGDIADLEEHVHLNQQALVLRPEGHPDRSSSLNNLANALSDRYERFGDVADLEEYVRLTQEALTLHPEGHPDRSVSLNNLASALSDRYTRFGDVADLEEHVRLNQQALALHPEGHPNRSASLNNLANALSDRYARIGDVADLEERIRLHQEALALRRQGHPDRSSSLSNLAIAFRDRYARFGNIADLDECIRLFQDTLTLHQEGHPRRSASITNLAAALNARYARFGDVTDLEEHVHLFHQALAIHPEGHPNRSASLNNLAAALSDRYARFDEVADLEGAISHLRAGSVDVHCPQAIALQCALNWVDITKKHDHVSLGEACTRAVTCVRQYLSIGPTAQLQYTILLREARTASLSVDAAAYFIEKGHAEKAVEILDEGRALLISEMRRLREPISPNERVMIGEELSARYLDVCENLRNISNSEVRFETFSSSSLAIAKPDAGEGHSSVAYGELLKEKRVKMEEYTNLLHQIRQIQGCEGFQRAFKFEKLKDAAKEGPVVVINCSKRRSDVIIVFAHRSPLHIPLDEDFFQIMQDISKCYLASLSGLSTTEDIVTALSETLELVVEELWTNVVRQVVDALQDSGFEKGSRIWWCPTSFLTSLPFHAAGNGSEWLIDHYVSSYTPTLSALISARQAAIQEPLSPGILVVAQTKTSGLKNAEPELQEMQKLASFGQCLDEEEATPQSVTKHLPLHGWAHFICHGTVTDNPFESYLHLYDGSKLTLNDIIKLHITDARFAFLAACHSAAQSREKTVLRDEILHLAAAMQVSGFRSVVGTMWQMQDEDGPRMARKFYAEIFKDEHTGDKRHTLTAHALWKAVRWLKDESMTEERKALEGKRKEKKEEEAGDVGRKEGRKEGRDKEKREKRPRKKKIPIARWANYIHIGA